MVEGQEGVTWTEWVALARTCEAHGIPKLFRSDHYLNLGGVAERGSLDAWGTVCALAAVTSTLRLGTLVSPATFRHPSELAKLVTTADRISDGRVELGLGAGWNDREHAAVRIPVRRAADADGRAGGAASGRARQLDGHGAGAVLVRRQALHPGRARRRAQTGAAAAPAAADRRLRWPAQLPSWPPATATSTTPCSRRSRMSRRAARDWPAPVRRPAGRCSRSR